MRTASPTAGGAIVTGASAGGAEALRTVVLHVPGTSSSALPAVLDRAGPLPGCSEQLHDPA